MKTWKVPLAGLITILAGVIAADRIVARPLDHPPVMVSLTQEDLAPHPALLLGRWEGSWDGNLSCRLVVEDIHGKWPSVLYAWGVDQSGGAGQEWVQTRAKILPDGRLQIGALTFALSEDGVHLVGTWGYRRAFLQRSP